MTNLLTKIIILAFLLPITAIAENRYGFEPSLLDLNIGMTQNQIIGVWGAPKEKIEKETKRQEIWRYPEYSLVFSEAKLLQVEDNMGQAVLKPQIEEEDEGLPDPIIPEPRDFQVEQILSEIIGTTGK